MEELNTQPIASEETVVETQTPTEDNVSSFFNDVIKPEGHFATEEEFRSFLSDKNNSKSFFEDVISPEGHFGSFEEFSSFLNIGGVGKTQPYLGKTQVGQKEGSLKQDGLGLGLEKLQKVTGRTILPSDLTGSQLKQLSKQFNIPSFVSYSDQQYDELAKKLRGKSFYQAQIETAKTLPNRVEARKMTRSAYKGIKNELAADQQLLEDDINQVQQNIGQFEQQLTELKSVFEDVNQPQQIREAAANDFNEIQKQANDLISQSQPKIDAYNENQKTLASLGRLTEPKEVRKQINNGLDAWLAVNPYSPLNNPVVKGVSNAIVPSFLNTAAAIIDNPIMRMGYTDSGKLTADVLSNTLFEAAKGATITTTAEEEKSVFDELTPENVQYTIGNLLGYIIPSATGAGIVSKAAAPITSQLITGGQVYGNYYKEGLDAGLSKNEAALFASVPTIVTAYLGDKGVEMMLAGLSKQSIRSVIREAAKSSIGKSPSEIMKIAGNASKGFLEGVLKEGSQEGVEQLSEMVSKDVANNFADAKFEGDFTIDGYLRGVAEASTLGAVVGGPLGGIAGLSSSRNIADVAAQSLVDPNEEFTFRKTLQSLLQDGEIGQDEYDNVSNQFEVAKLAAQKIPNQVTDSELRTEATELIQEKEALNAEIQTKDPAMTTSLKNRVAEIDKRLGEISEGKAVAVEEEQTAPEEGLTVEEIKRGFQEQLDNIDITSPKAGQITSDIILDYIVAGNADSVEAAIDSGKPVDGKEASMLLDSLYTALARVDESVSMTAEQKADLQGILEPLISKIEGYDNITEGTTIKVTERQATARPVEDARKVKDQASAIENSRGKKGVLIRPSRRNPNQRVKENVRSIDPTTIPIESEVSIVRDDAGEIVGYSFTLPDGNELFVDDPGGGIDLALMQKNEIMGAPPQLMEQVFEDVMREVEVAAPTTKTETTKPTENAVQEQAAGKVPVQPKAGVSETMAEGKPEAEPKVVTEEGETEQAQATTEEKKEVNVGDALNIINALNEQTPGQTEEAPRTYTTKNIDRAINDARKAKDAKLEKALVDAKAIMKALGKKDTKVVIHFNQGSYTQSVIQAGGEAQASGSSGFVISKDGNTIHLNLPKIKSNEVVLHEGAHPVLDWITKNNPERIDALYTELESLAQVLPGVNDAIAFSKKYGNTTQAKKEAIVQFMALVADGTINLSEANPTFKQKAIEFIKKLLQAIGIDFGVKISDDASVVELAKRFTESVKYGREISVASKVGVGTPQMQIIGENAELVQDVRDNLQVARDMEAANQDAKTIRIATGWERGSDGKWRYEVQDLEFKKKIGRFEEDLNQVIRSAKNGNVEQYDLEQLIDSNLFDFYPSLKNTSVILSKRVVVGFQNVLGGADASYYKEGKRGIIAIKAKEDLTIEKLRLILVHEIQHAIQDIEGFAEGNYGVSMQEEVAAEKEINLLDNKIGVSTQILRDGNDSFLSENINELSDIEKVAYEDILDYSKSASMPILDAAKVKDRIWKKDKDTQQDILNQNERYVKTAGEVEARNVEARIKLTPEQRRATTLQETEDVARDSQIFLREGDMATGPQFSMAGAGAKKLSNEEISNLVDSYRGDTDELVKLSDTVSIQKRGNEYFVTAMRDTGVLYTFRPMNLAEAKIFAENNLYKENAGSNINPQKYSPQQKRAQNLKIGDIYTRTINGSRYVFQLMSDFRKDRLNGQFFNADVKVLDVGKQTLRKELSSDGKIKTFGYSVGQTTIDRFKNMDSPNGFNLGEVTVINDFESKPTTGPQFSLGGAVPISDVITALRNAGATEQVIADALKQSGYYTQEEINDAMGLPTPQPTPMIQPPVTPPSFGVEPENGTNQRVNSIYERMALKAESEGNLELAAEIRRRGLYNQRSKEQVEIDSNLLISAFNDDIEAAADFVMNNPINGDIRTNVLGKRMTRAKEAALSNRTVENLATLEQAIYDFAAYSTDLGQAVNEIKNVEANNPELFYLGRFSEYIATLADNLGNPAVTTTNASKIVKAAKDVVKLRKDILNQVANVISEMADDATIDSLMIDALKLDKAGKDRVLTKRMRDGLRKITGSVESKKIIGEKLKKLAELGVFGLEETRDEVKELIRKGLAEINPTLQTPLDTAEIQEMAEMFMIIYEEMATQKMDALLDKAFNGNNKNNAAVIKAVMYGALDTPNALNKFAQKFGLSYITPQMQQQLRNAAQNVANAKGNTARSIAQAAFTTMLNKFIYQTKPAGYKILTSSRSFFKYFANVYYNTALFAFNTFFRAFQGNTLRTLGNVINALTRGEFDIVKDSFRDVYFRKKVPFNYTDRNGVIRSIDAKTQLVFDDIYSSLRGLPRLAEVKREGGLTQVEIDIRNTDSRLKRRLLRAFAVPASRIMGAVDASVMPLNMFLTKRQAFYEVLKAFYKDKGITISKKTIPGVSISEADLRIQLNSILGVDTDYVSKAMEQAVVDVMGSKLWTDLGFTNADEFPMVDPRYGPLKLRLPQASRESKIYNEFLFRTREILDSEENKRLQDSFSKTGYGATMTQTESDLMSAAIDNYALKVSGELAFLGTPRGSMRLPAETISKLSTKYPFLKYIGLSPLFTNAAFNSVSMAIRIAPGLNALQYLKYWYTGTRGGQKGSQKEFGADYEQLTKIDQNKMLKTVLLTNTLFLVATALKPYDDKEEEKKAIDNKTWTGSTPLKITKAQTDLGYLPGRIYIKGEGYDYRDNPLALLISGISFVRNYGLWSFDNKSNNFYVEDDGEIGYDPTFIEQASAYAQYIITSMLEFSTIKDMSKTYSDIIEILSPPTGEDDIKQKELASRFVNKKGANIIRTSIPYSRFVAEMKTITDAIMDEEKKLPITFYDNIVFGHAIEDNVIKTNGYDFFGRPVKDAFTLVSPFVSSFSINQDPKADREHTLYRKMNYTPKLFLNDRLAVHITLDDLNGDANKFEDFFKTVKLEEKKGDGLVADVERKSKTEQRVLVSLFMSKEEANLVNQKACEFAGKFVEENFADLQSMDMARFKDAMNSIYNIGREVAIYQNLGNLIEYDKEDYYSMINDKIIKFKNTYVGSTMDNLTWPQEFEPSSILGDSFETEPKVIL